MTILPRIGFIGAGRLARTVALGLSRAGLSVSAVASRSHASAKALADFAPGCRVVPQAQDVVDGAGLVFLTVPDDSIRSICASLRWRPGAAVVHCSGATEVDALSHAAQAGAMTGGFHPLQLFGEPTVSIDALPGSTVAVEASEPLLAWLHALAGSLGCRTIVLPPGARVRYHASGSLAAGFLGPGLQQGIGLWRSFGIGEQEALAALLPLIEGVLATIRRAGVLAATAGPVSRGDAGVVARHIDALRAAGPEPLALYRALLAEQLPLAEKRGLATPAALAQIRALLASS